MREQEEQGASSPPSSVAEPDHGLLRTSRTCCLEHRDGVEGGPHLPHEGASLEDTRPPPHTSRWEKGVLLSNWQMFGQPSVCLGVSLAEVGSRYIKKGPECTEVGCGA